MVAIALYKGNLHKVPDVPRRWTIAAPSISPHQFKSLIRRRAIALARLHQISLFDDAPFPSPEPPSDPPSDPEPVPASKVGNQNVVEEKEVRKEEEGKVKDEEEEEKKMDLVEKLVEKADELVGKEEGKIEAKAEVGSGNPVVVVEASDSGAGMSETKKRKKEVEEKLEVLNEKKHNLVQVLKQILNAEEQLRRQNSMQGLSGRPPLPLQVDATTDSGSMTRVNTPRLGSDGNPLGDLDGGEGDDASNQNKRARHLLCMSSTSPSSESQLRKPGSNMVPHTVRTTLGVAGSPSRFAPAGQVHSVSVSGTSYIASSPSPAASGGTSVFRDGRQPSPWN